jgi:4-nitrophenyl phosphatase
MGAAAAMTGLSGRLRPIRGLVSDLDGTLLAGSRDQPGLAEFVAFLRKNGICLRVVTNNSVRTPEEFAQKLLAAGALVSPGEVLTSAVATAEHLAGRLPWGAPVFVVGETGLVDALSAAGFAIVEDSTRQAAAVVVGGDRMVNHDKLKHAIRHVRGGAFFVGTNPDLLVPVEDGLAPEAGVLLAAVSAGAGVAPDIIGKPERPLLEQALRSMGTPLDATAILGDRLDTDVLGGKRLELTTILVTTGIDDRSAINAKAIEPDLVVSGLDELTQLWERALKE